MSALAEIVARKRIEIAERRAAVSEAELEKRAVQAPDPRGLYEALAPSHAKAMRVIAEIKRASPSVGEINRGVDAPKLALSYSRAGASAISVLTDGPGFGGSLDDLRAVRRAVGLPLLRKDFMLDRYQLLEAREAGADVVLLIVAALEREQLRFLISAAYELGLDQLVEVHDERELETALECGARVVGINNRDLKTFTIDLGTSEKLLPKIPADVRAVAESGVKTLDDAKRLRDAGARNLLVGEALVRDPSLLEKLVRA